MPDGLQTRDDLTTYRRAALQPKSYDADARTVDVVWTTGADVQRSDWATGKQYTERLDVEGADLGRLNAGAPLLDAHASFSARNVVGVVVPGSARVEDGVGVARVQLSAAADVADNVLKITEGVLRNISVGYAVREWSIDKDEQTGAETRTAVRWEPMELSAVPIPADAGAQVRAQEREAPAQEPVMTEQTKPAEVVDIAAVRAEAAAQAAEIAATAVRSGMTAEQAQALAAKPRAEAQAEIIRHLTERQKPTEVNANHSGVTVKTDHDEQVMRGTVEALMVRGGARDVELSPAGRAQMQTSLLRLAERCIRQNGGRPEDMTERQVAETVLQRSFAGAHSTSDFPFILANVANKFLRSAFAEEPMTHTAFSYTRPVRDTKQISVVSLGSVDALPKVVEGAEYTYATIGEGREVYNLAKFGQILPFTVEMLLNDDLGAFGRLATEMGRAAARTEKGLVYGTSGVLGSNSGAGETMAAEGSIAAAALHAATHSNLGTGGALSASTLAEMRQLLLSQTDRNGNIIGGLMPKILLVPAALLDTAEILQQARYVPTTAANGASMWISGLQVIAEPRIDAVNAAGYYLISDPFVEIAKLQGEEAPTISRIEHPEADQIGLKVRYWCAAKAVTWRNSTYNAGS